MGPNSPSILVGIGDDAAVLAPPQSPIVATVDACVEGVHFTRQIASLEDIGYRSFMAAASDLAAMGARPLAALSAITLPSKFAEHELEELVQGQRLAANALELPIVGGNLSRGSILTISTTALGEAKKPVLRSGATPGQRLWLAGAVGLAAAGLRALMRGICEPSAALQQAILAWRRPTALLSIGTTVAKHIDAMIDISDGLAQDAAHIAIASEVHLVLHFDQVIRAHGSTTESVAVELGEDAGALAFAGGEDYALLAASGEDLRGHGFVEVGEVRAGESGVTVLRDGAVWRPPSGFDHGEASS